MVEVCRTLVSLGQDFGLILDCRCGQFGVLVELHGWMAVSSVLGQIVSSY